MSSSQIRTLARSLSSAAGWPSGLPYKETFSDAPNPATLPDAWFTVSFQYSATDPVSIGPTVLERESGAVIVSGLARSGDGDGTLLALLDTARPLIKPHFEASSGVYVNSVSTPTDADPDVDGEWLRLDLTVDYQRDFTS